MPINASHRSFGQPTPRDLAEKLRLASVLLDASTAEQAVPQPCAGQCCYWRLYRALLASHGLIIPGDFHRYGQLEQMVLLRRLQTASMKT